MGIMEYCRTYKALDFFGASNAELLAIYPKPFLKRILTAFLAFEDYSRGIKL